MISSPPARVYHNAQVTWFLCFTAFCLDFSIVAQRQVFGLGVATCSWCQHSISECLLELRLQLCSQFQPPVNTHPGRYQVMVPVLCSLSHTWKTWTGFLAPGFGLAPDIAGTVGCDLFLPLYLCLPFKSEINKFKFKGYCQKDHFLHDIELPSTEKQKMHCNT